MRDAGAQAVILRSLPRCARCGATVAEMLVWDSAEPEHVLLVIRCHGEAETLSVPLALLKSSRAEIAVTLAFVDRPADPEAMRWEDLPEADVVR